MQKMGWFEVLRGHSRSWAMSPFGGISLRSLASET